MNGRKKKKGFQIEKACDEPRFITITWETGQPWSKWYRKHAQSGLQIGKKIYFTDGKSKSLFGTNQANTIIVTRVHYPIPDWAGTLLTEKYNKAVDALRGQSQ